MFSYLKPPGFFRLVAWFLRNTPYIQGKGRICHWMGRFVRGKGYSTIIPFDRGEKILLDLDDWISFQVFFTGLYVIERTHTNYFRKAIREGDVVLDIGANIGYYTLQASVRVGNRGEVHAFEPVSRTFARLESNIRLNNIGNVRANRLIVHDHLGEMNIYVADESNTGASSLLSNVGNLSGKVETASCVTIDHYLGEAGVSCVNLVKIDVEGSEMAVLRGMQNTIERNLPHIRLLIEIDQDRLISQGYSQGVLLEFMGSFGLYPYKIQRRAVKPLARSEHFDSLTLFQLPAYRDNKE